MKKHLSTIALVVVTLAAQCINFTKSTPDFYFMYGKTPLIPEENAKISANKYEIKVTNGIDNVRPLLISYKNNIRKFLSVLEIVSEDKTLKIIKNKTENNSSYFEISKIELIDILKKHTKKGGCQLDFYYKADNGSEKFKIGQIFFI